MFDIEDLTHIHLDEQQQAVEFESWDTQPAFGTFDYQQVPIDEVRRVYPWLIPALLVEQFSNHFVDAVTYVQTMAERLGDDALHERAWPMSAPLAWSRWRALKLAIVDIDDVLFPAQPTFFVSGTTTSHAGLDWADTEFTPSDMERFYPGFQQAWEACDRLKLSPGAAALLIKTVFAAQDLGYPVPYDLPGWSAFTSALLGYTALDAVPSLPQTEAALLQDLIGATPPAVETLVLPGNLSENAG